MTAAGLLPGYQVRHELVFSLSGDLIILVQVIANLRPGSLRVVRVVRQSENLTWIYSSYKFWLSSPGIVIYHMGPLAEKCIEASVIRKIGGMAVSKVPFSYLVFKH